jgi:hypothetical protein
MAKQFPNQIDTAPEAPAGFQRTEQRLRRKDDLEQQAEERAQATGVEAASSDAFLPDEEIQNLLQYDGSNVSKAQKGYCYMWVCIEFPASARGLAVLNMTAQGWQVVKGDDPEAQEYLQPDRTRKLGDSILLRISEARKRVLDGQIAMLNAKREGQSHEAVRNLAERHGIKIVSFDEMSPEQQKQLERRSQLAFAKQGAFQKLDGNLRAGTVPGAAVGR